MSDPISVNIMLPLHIESEANKREHWAVKASRTKAHRSTACLMIAPHRRQILSLGPKLHINLCRIAPRELDDDNLARGFKATRDGIADGLGMDDRDKRLKWSYSQEQGKPGQYAAWVEIRGEATVQDTRISHEVAPGSTISPESVALGGACLGECGGKCSKNKQINNKKGRAVRGK